MRATLPNMPDPPNENPPRGDLPEPREKSFNKTPCTLPDPFCRTRLELPCPYSDVCICHMAGNTRLLFPQGDPSFTNRMAFVMCSSKGSSTSSLPSQRYGSLSTLSRGAHCQYQHRGYIRSFLGPWSPHHSFSEGGHTIPPRIHAGLEEASETEPLMSLSPIHTIREWSRMLLTHTHEDFASLTILYKDHACPP